MTGPADPSAARAGFSLLEVLIALAVLSIGLTAALRLDVMDLTLIKESDRLTTDCLTAESILWRYAVLERPSTTGRNQDKTDKRRYQVEATTDPELGGLIGLKLTIAPLDANTPRSVFKRTLIPKATE